MRIQLYIICLSLLIISCSENNTNKSENDSSIKIETKKDSALSNPKMETKSQDGDFIFFWDKFRNAVITNDTNTIISLTKFPFETRGPLDHYPIVKFEKENFLKVFNAFLNQWTGMIEGESELDNIKNTINPDNNYIRDNWARVGDLQFNKINDEWRLTFAYLNDETIEEIKE